MWSGASKHCAGGCRSQRVTDARLLVGRPSCRLVLLLVCLGKAEHVLSGKAPVHALSRRGGHRGSGVRLDLQEPFRVSSLPRSALGPYRCLWQVIIRFPRKTVGHHINEFSLLAVYGEMVESFARPTKQQSKYRGSM